MKSFLITCLVFLSTNVFASDCSQFPNRSGSFSKDVYVKGLLVSVKAELRINKGVEFGKAYTSHSFQSPEFIVDGRRVSVDSGSAKEIFSKLGYQSLSYTVQHKVGIFERGFLLDSDLRVRRVNSGEYILRDLSPINAYHPVCSNWQY